MENVVSIFMGGHCKLTKSWVAEYEVVDDIKFVPCQKLCGQFKRFVDNDFTMLDHLMVKRDIAVVEAMIKSVADGDGDAPDGGSLPKRPRKEMFDNIERVVTLSVQTKDNVFHDVRVLSARAKRDHLKIELVPAKLELLTKQPIDDMESEMRPDLTQFPNCKWLPQRKCTRVVYFSEKAKCMKQMHRRVAPGDEFQTRAEEAATFLGKFREDNHNVG